MELGIKRGPGAQGDALEPDPLRLEMLRPTWYCDKLPWNLKPWVQPALAPEQVVIHIASGANIMHTRAVAARDTWLTQFPKHIIVGDVADASIPMLGMSDHYLVTGKGKNPDGSKRDRDPTMAFHMEGFALAYRKWPNQSWYGTAGDDQYLNADYVLRLLQDVTKEHDDPNIPLYVTTARYPRAINGNVSWSHWPAGAALQEKGTFTWASGAVIYFLNNKAMALFNEHVEYLVKNTVPETNLCGNCPDVYTGLLMSLLGVKHVLFPTQWNGAFSPLALDHHKLQVGHTEHLANHYVSPRKMLAMHERATHEKIDRMINAGSVQLIIDFFREFVEHHFLVLRKRQQEVVALAAKSGQAGRIYDIPVPDTFAANPYNEFGPPLSDPLYRNP